MWLNFSCNTRHVINVVCITMFHIPIINYHVLKYCKLFFITRCDQVQIQRSALLDDGMSHAHYLTPGRTYCEGSIKTTHILYFDYSSLQKWEYNFTISVTQFSLFRSLETVLVLYNLIIWVLCFNAHVTCIHSNTCGGFDMIEPLE